MSRNDYGRATAILTILGMLAAGVWAVEARYAKAGDVQELKQEIRATADDLKLALLESRLFDLDRAQAIRPLTTLEEFRQDEVRREIDTVKARIRARNP